MQCRVDLCAATYKSFNAADCTYQPFGGGPRQICGSDAQRTGIALPPSRVATDPGSAATDTRPMAAAQPVTKAAAAERAGSQCNLALCATTYRSFHAADCTYQPEGGGPRQICELNKGAAEAPQQMSRAATGPRDAISKPDDSGVAARAHEVAESAMPDRAGPQCNLALCAATYHSFHAADCTYQPEGGGPRRICEP
jgi:hypothetical protein